jgi:hypothetical protein
MSDAPLKPNPPARDLSREARRLARLRRLRLVEAESPPVEPLRPLHEHGPGPKEAA